MICIYHLSVCSLSFHPCNGVCANGVWILICFTDFSKLPRPKTWSALSPYPRSSYSVHPSRHSDFFAEHPRCQRCASKGVAWWCLHAKSSDNPKARHTEGTPESVLGGSSEESPSGQACAEDRRMKRGGGSQIRGEEESVQGEART